MFPLRNAYLSLLSVRSRLTETLPRYMVPQRWMALDGLPRNNNGKTDRPLLKQWFQQQAEMDRRDFDSGTVRPDEERQEPVARSCTELSRETFWQSMFLQSSGERRGTRSSSHLVSEISELMRAKLLLDVKSPEQDLLDSGLLDSLTLVQLLLDLESRFGVAIPLEELELDDFRTLESIARLIQRRKSAVDGESQNRLDDAGGKEDIKHSAPAYVTPVMRGSAGHS